MDDEKRKRARGSNYTPGEQRKLLEIVHRFVDIVECKSTCGEYVRKKKKAWAAITAEFNEFAVSGHRTSNQLRTLYDNIKQRCKKDQMKRCEDNTREFDISVEMKPFDQSEIGDSFGCYSGPEDTVSQDTKDFKDFFAYTEKLMDPDATETELNHEYSEPDRKIYYTTKLNNAQLKQQFLENELRRQRQQIIHEKRKHKLEIYLLKLKIRRMRKFAK